MCSQFHDPPIFLILGFPDHATQRDIRSALGDVLAFIGDALCGGDRTGRDQSVTLSPQGADGLKLLLSALEESLRFDVREIRPSPSPSAPPAADGH